MRYAAIAMQNIVEVGGKFEVDGSLFVSDRLEGYGVIEIGGNFESTHSSSQRQIDGKQDYCQRRSRYQRQNGNKAGTESQTGDCEKRQPMRRRLNWRTSGSWKKRRFKLWEAWRNLIGQGSNWAAAGGMARVDDVYATEVVIGPMSRAGRIFADTVKLEQGSAAEQVTYTDELKMDFGAAISEAPKKVDTLAKATILS